MDWGDIVVQVSDPVLPDFFGKSREEEGITLHFKPNDGRQTPCHPNVGEIVFGTVPMVSIPRVEQILVIVEEHLENLLRHQLCRLFQQ